jgi:peptide/nickel transport system substrate-binding protein
MDKNSVNIQAAAYRKLFKTIEMVDRYSVALHLKQTAPELVYDLVKALSPIICKKYTEKVGDQKAMFHPIGSGPYRLVEHKPGEYLKFEASDKHWRVLPEFKYIVVHIVPEESTRIALLKTGAADIAPVTAQHMADLQKTTGITAEPWPGGYNIFACFGGMLTPADKRYKEGYHSKDPWVDRRVREAMNLAIDRQAIVKSVYLGAATPISICWSLPGWDKLPPIPYDPERAKKLLAEAGYPNGFDVTVSATSAWAPAYEIPQVMEIVAAYFEAIGLKVKIKPMDKPQIRALNRSFKDVGMIYPWKDTVKDTYAGRYKDRFAPGANTVYFLSDELTALINKYEPELDPEKRAAYLAQIRDYWVKEWATIPIIVAQEVWAFRNTVVGEWPRSSLDKRHYFSYIRHAKPLNTFRLFEMD